ncbi:MAG: LysR family transcriptional regulator [Microvirga sp.]|nr:LysR family transcriptional regulator [Microvirga sp.]
MNLRQLRFFVAVAEELHFGRAADRLGMTQPPLSQAIIALEEELGVTLFARTKRSVALTPVGEHWLPRVRALIAEADELPGYARQLARGEVGSLKLGFVTTADYNVLPQLISRYGAAYPDVKVSLREMTSDLQVEALLQGEINVGVIIPSAETAHGSLAYRPLMREPLVAVIPESWAASGELDCAPGALRLADLAERPLVIFPRRSAPAFHDLVTDYYARHGVAPRIGQEAIQMQTIISLVSAGMGVSFAPLSLTNLGRAGVRYVQLADDAPELETGLTWRRDDPSPTLRRLVEIADVQH